MAGGVVIVIGAPGAGKTSLLEALSTLLERERVGHGALESEQLSMGWPLLPAASWLAQLEAVLALQRAAGRGLFLLSATVEQPAELEQLVGAAGAEPTLVVGLAVRPATAAARIVAREPDSRPGKRRLVELARELAGSIGGFAGIDLVLDAETLTPDALARDVCEAMRERGLLRQDV